ncbi:MAG: ABC transporter permease, partial [Thermoguttaceae bacterium]
MTGLRLVCSSLRYHWRVQAAVACGVAAATAVLCGALIVGDSMRASLRRLSLDRLGRIEYALVSERFFREALAGELAARADLPRRSAAAVPVILLRSSLEVPQSGGLARAWRVNLVGCDERFWQLGPGGPSRAPQPGQIVLNRPVAEQLGVAEGGHVLVRLPRLGGIPGEMPLGRRARTVTGEILVLSQIIPAEGLGRFSLRPNQQEPPNAYVPLKWLQERLGQHEKRGPEGDLAEPARVNALLVAGPPGTVEAQLDAAEIQAALRPDLPDYGIRVHKTSRGYLNITSERLILEPAAEEAIRRAIGDRPVQPAFTYLADTIACGKREMPYALIAAVDFTSEPPFGPMRTPEGRPIGRLADDQIVLNAWAAEDLQARPGDTIHVEYFEPESTHGQLRRQGRDFRLAAVVAMAGPAADPDFTPEVPGVTDQQSVANWDLPSVVDPRRVRRKDDQYWQQHRGTPKAFISLAAGRRLWASRFGQTTSLRVPANQGLTPQRLQQRIALEPAAMGLVFQPVRQQGLEASAGTTPFEVLFLLFSSFLLAAAAILVALLFRLGIDRRATEIGILLAIGLRRRQVAGLLLREGLLVAAAGGLLGVIVGIAYAALLLAGLQSWWLAAVNARFLRLELSLKSLAIGFASGVLFALLSIVWSVVQAGGQPPRQLLAGQAAPESTRRRAGQRRRLRAAWAGLAAPLGLGRGASPLAQAAQAA